DPVSAETDVLPLENWPCELFVWSGESAGAVRRAAAELRERLEVGARPVLKDLAALVTRQGAAGGPARLALTAESIDELVKKLQAADAALADGPETVCDPRGIFFAASAAAPAGKVAFMFPGQASQRPDMLRDLAVLFPEVRERFAAADRTVGARLPLPLSEYIFPPPRYRPDDAERAMAALTATAVAQPALGAASLGMLHALRRLGLRADMAAGHSTGEYMALYAAGALSEEALYGVLAERGRVMAERTGEDAGTMLAVKAGREEIEPALEGREDVYFANFNAPRQTILSGRADALEAVAARLKERGITSRILAVSCGFHSPFVAPARDAFAEALDRVAFQAPAFTVFSNVTAAPHENGAAAMRERLAEHVVRPVRFTEEVEAMYAAGARIFVEVGPGNVCTNLIKQVLEGKPAAALATDVKGARHGLVPFLQALGELFVQGVALDLRTLFDRRRIETLDPVTLASARKPQSRTRWMLAPDRAWPAGEPKPSRRKVDLAATAPPQAAPAAPVPRPAPAASPAGATPTAQVVAQYQKLMADFMEQQKQVMLAFLGQAPAGAGASLPAAAPPAPAAPAAPAPAAPAVPAAPVAPAEAQAEPVTETAPAGGETGASDGDLQSKLINIVSDRTGYPADMLDLDLDLEADLGIDSIKRVEILTTFGKSLRDVPEGMAEKLRGARTLRSVIAIAGNGHD
ncbi:MAG: acyltransferase domain-containing protein, partial [Lentisphaerae bacterium]|nr:acyltransferase domain-containing protein [Lentisphaerota bacterium]